MDKILDISYRDEKTAALSNLFPYEFEIDGIKCASMEGFIRCLTVDDTTSEGKTAKKMLCGLYGVNAYKIRYFLRDWRTTQTIFWNNKEIVRQSEEYKELITKAYDCLYQNVLFKMVLDNVPKSIMLDHSIGKTDNTETLLTKYEYIYQLDRLRNI